MRSKYRIRQAGQGALVGSHHHDYGNHDGAAAAAGRQGLVGDARYQREGFGRDDLKLQHPTFVPFHTVKFGGKNGQKEEQIPDSRTLGARLATGRPRLRSVDASA